MQNNHLFSTQGLNPRLRGILGGVIAIAMLIGLVWIGTGDFTGGENLQSSVVDATATKVDSANTKTVISSTTGNPVVLALSQMAAKPGSTLTVKGKNFDRAAANNLVWFGEIASPVELVRQPVTGQMELDTKVPDLPAGEYDLAVQTLTGSGFIGGKFVVLADAPASVPVITEIDPASGSVGSAIYLLGQNFSGTAANNKVEFTTKGGGKVTATGVEVVYREGARALRVVVPSGAVTGHVSLTIGEVTADSGMDFTVLSSEVAAEMGGESIIPTIYEVSTYTPNPGQQVMVRGSNLLNRVSGTPSTEGVTVDFNGEPATIKKFSVDADGYDVLLIVAPGRSVSGYLTIAVDGRTAISSEPFKIIDNRPQADATRNKTHPEVITPEVALISFYTFFGDSDGVGDITGINIDLSSIGGSPSNSMIPGEIEGNGRVYGLVDFALPKPLELDTEYRLPIVATDTAGHTGRTELVFCSGACGEEPELDMEPEVTEPVGPVSTLSPAPINLTAKLELGGIRLDWQPPVTSTGVTGYYAYYSTRPGSYLHRLPLTTGQTHWFSGLQVGKVHYFTVTAIDASGKESERSNEASLLVF